MDAKDELRAELEALSSAFTTLVDACLERGVIPADAMRGRLERLEAAPTHIGTDPEYNAAYRRALGAWADMMYMDQQADVRPLRHA